MQASCVVDVRTLMLVGQVVGSKELVGGLGGTGSVDASGATLCGKGWSDPAVSLGGKG